MDMEATVELKNPNAGHPEPTLVEEAIARAANSIKSLASSIVATENDEAEEENKGCIQDPGPSNGDVPDALVGGGSQPLPSCGGGDVEEELERRGPKNEVVIVGGAGEVEPATADSVLVLEEYDTQDGTEKKACPVDGLEGADGREIRKNKWQGEDVEEDEGRDGDKPILVEDLI